MPHTLSGGGGVSSQFKEFPVFTTRLVWFVAEDIFYYENIKSVFSNIKIEILPNKDNIFQILKLILETQDILICISNQKPYIEIENFFEVINLPNKYGFLTTQQKQMGLSEAKVLEAKLGMSVIDSPFKLDDIGGAEPLKKYARELIEAEKNGYKAKGIFLVGIPGTGKTFFPKCFAGETNRLLILLNLSQIMESVEPILKLNSIFEYLHDRHKQFPDEKYIILIDEIEKMIGSTESKVKQMLGRLLTVLNDIHTPACEYIFNAIFFATANNLGTLLQTNPEFLRRGRWDELFFISMPVEETVEDIFRIYIKKFGIEEIFNYIDLQYFVVKVAQQYKKDNSIAHRYPYTPAEIESICKRLSFMKKAKGSISKEDIDECSNLIIPLVISAQSGVEDMAGQERLFITI